MKYSVAMTLGLHKNPGKQKDQKSYTESLTLPLFSGFPFTVLRVGKFSLTMTHNLKAIIEEGESTI